MNLTEHNVQPPPAMDLLAEEWALELIERHALLPEDIVFRAESDHGRSGRHDVLKAELRSSPNSGEEQVFLELRRNGLYDGLPEALFHDAGSARSIKQNAEEDRNEQRARDFFQPFEQELHRLRLALRAEEADMLARSADEVHGQALADLWLLSANLGTAARSALLKVLPQINAVNGDLAATAACFTHVLGHPVRITQTSPTVQMVPSELVKGLGKAELAGDFVSGGHFHDGWPGLLVELLDLSATVLADTSERRRLRRMAELLAAYFLPAHLEVSYDLHVQPADEGFQLGDPQRPALLAMNTCL